MNILDRIKKYALDNADKENLVVILTEDEVMEFNDHQLRSGFTPHGNNMISYAAEAKTVEYYGVKLAFLEYQKR